MKSIAASVSFCRVCRYLFGRCVDEICAPPPSTCDIMPDDSSTQPSAALPFLRRAEPGTYIARS